MGTWAGEGSQVADRDSRAGERWEAMGLVSNVNFISSEDRARPPLSP